MLLMFIIVWAIRGFLYDGEIVTSTKPMWGEIQRKVRRIPSASCDLFVRGVSGAFVPLLQNGS